MGNFQHYCYWCKKTAHIEEIKDDKCPFCGSYAWVSDYQREKYNQFKKTQVTSTTI